MASQVHRHTELLQGLENWIYLQQQKQGCEKKKRRNGGVAEGTNCCILVAKDKMEFSSVKSLSRETLKRPARRAVTYANVRQPCWLVFMYCTEKGRTW